MAKLRNHFLLKIPSSKGQINILPWYFRVHLLMFILDALDFFAWNSSNYRENKFDIRSTKLPPIKIFSQLTQAFLEILKSRIWSIRAATIIEHIWLCSLLFYHWVQWFNLQFLQCKMKYILKRSFFVGYSFLLYSNVNIFLSQEQVINF